MPQLYQIECLKVFIVKNNLQLKITNLSLFSNSKVIKYILS